VGFHATDGRGGVCEGAVLVCVPRDQRPGHSCTDGGSLYDSRGPCGGKKGTAAFISRH
jgi:hypothetical protein